MIPQEEMLSSISLSSDSSTIHITGNTIGELAISCSSFWPAPICIFEDDIVGSVVTNNRLSRNARITMTNNNFGWFRVTASLLALTFSLQVKCTGQCSLTIGLAREIQQVS